MAEQSCHNVAQSAFLCQFCDQHNVKWKCEDCGIFICNSCKEKVHPRLKSSDKHKVLSINDIGKDPCYDNEAWFYGKITRKDAVKIIEKYKHMGNGSFLVRESESNIGSYSLDVVFNNEPTHFKIKQKRENGQLKFATHEKWFDNLNDLLDFYKQDPMAVTRRGVTGQLTVPIPKEPIT